MKKLFRLAMLLNLTFFLLFSGCVPPTPGAAAFSQTPTVIPFPTVVEIQPTRLAKFENTLAMSIDRRSISFTRKSDAPHISGRISLNIILRSSADFPIFFRTPQVVDVNRWIIEGAISDFTVVITLPADRDMAFDGFGIGTIDYEKVTEKDYVRIEPHQTVSLPISLDVPHVYLPDTEYSGTIPEGEYEILIVYENYTIGYDLPLLKTPPANLTIEEEQVWQFQNEEVVDLDAWVGTIVSEKVKFTIPE